MNLDAHFNCVIGLNAPSIVKVSATFVWAELLKGKLIECYTVVNNSDSMLKLSACYLCIVNGELYKGISSTHMFKVSLPITEVNNVAYVNTYSPWRYTVEV